MGQIQVLKEYTYEGTYLGPQVSHCSNSLYVRAFDLTQPSINMSKLLSLPRELRDQIYREVVSDNTSLKPSPGPRKCIVKSKHSILKSNTNESTLTGNLIAERAVQAQPGPAPLPEPEYPEGEAALRYSLAEPVPPTSSLLQSCRQLRAELLDSIRKTKVNYRIRLAFRDDADTIYPTWISLPAFASHIDVLTVDIRTRAKKTPSLFSMADSEAEWDTRPDVFLGALVLLRRFLERGPLFLARKKAKGITIDTLLLHIQPKDYSYGTSEEVFQDAAESLDKVLLYGDEGDYHGKDFEYRDEFYRFFATRITRVRCRVDYQSKEWLFADILQKVDERQAQRMRDEAGIDADLWN